MADQSASGTAEPSGVSAAAVCDGPAAATPSSVSESGYHYWHSKVAQGENAAPKPEHTPIAVEPLKSDNLPSVSIENFALMDDDDIVKVYIKLEGDLQGATTDHIEFKVEKARYDTHCSMLLHIRGVKQMHRLYAEKLRHPVDPDACKFRISAKTNKLIITLKKAVPEYWDGLRAPNSLPYRRGGGGTPR